MAVRISAGWVGPFYYRPENSLGYKLRTSEVAPQGWVSNFTGLFPEVPLLKCWIL